MSEENYIQSAIISGAEAANVDVRTTTISGLPVATFTQVTDDGQTIQTAVEVLKDVVALADERAPTPRRLRGISRHDEIGSFIAHANRFKTERSAIYADIAKVNLTAVLNYHGNAAAPEWSDHRSIYACPLSREWKLWIKHNEASMSQDVFGQFIEDNLADLASPSGAPGALDPDLPSPAAVLDMARNLVVRTKGEFARQVNVTTGESALNIKVENESTSTKIPRAFLLQLRVFEGQDAEIYAVVARIRFRMDNGRPVFAYSLDRHENVLRDAFAAVRKAAADGTSLPVFAGAPES